MFHVSGFWCLVQVSGAGFGLRVDQRECECECECECACGCECECEGVTSNGASDARLETQDDFVHGSRLLFLGSWLRVWCEGLRIDGQGLRI